MYTNPVSIQTSDLTPHLYNPQKRSLSIQIPDQTSNLYSPIPDPQSIQNSDPDLQSMFSHTRPPPPPPPIYTELRPDSQSDQRPYLYRLQTSPAQHPGASARFENYCRDKVGHRLKLSTWEVCLLFQEICGRFFLMENLLCEHPLRICSQGSDPLWVFRNWSAK